MYGEELGCFGVFFAECKKQLLFLSPRVSGCYRMPEKQSKFCEWSFISRKIFIYVYLSCELTIFGQCCLVSGTISFTL